MNDPHYFDWSVVSPADQALAKSIMGELRNMDRRITYDGHLWFARWYLVKNDAANVFFHMQMKIDPVGLHSHPWDNTTVYLAGSVFELLTNDDKRPHDGNTFGTRRKPGDVVHRDAAWAHRLCLESPYAMTLFMTGKMYRHWGFWRDGSDPPNGLLPTQR